MLGAFLYLTSRTFSNRIVRQLRRIRQPRYAIAVILGVFYLWFFIFSRSFGGGAGPLSNLTGNTARDLITVGVFLLFLTGWVFGRRLDALAFSQPEVYFLFPAPVSRRGLIVYRLFRIQIATLVSTIIWMVLLRRGGPTDLNPLLRAMGLWSLFGALSLNRIGAALVSASIVQHGVAGLRRQRIVSLIIAVLIALFGWAALSAWQAVGADPATPVGFIGTLDVMMRQPLLSALMSPFRVLATAAFAAGTDEWLRAIPFTLGILAIHFLWVVSANTAFEEAAVDASARIAKRIANFRARGMAAAPSISKRTLRSTSLPLSVRGPPAVAIIWKNSLAFLRSLRGTTVFMILLFAMPFFVTLFMVSDPRAARAVLMLEVGMILLWSVMLGPRFVRNDLRADLGQLTLLKSYPLSGSRIVGAEVSSSAISLSAIQMALILLAYVIVATQGSLRVSRLDMTLGLLAAPLCLLALNAVNFTIQNGAALLFPAWTAIGLNRPTGVEAIGQGILFALGSFILLGLSMIPSAIAALVAWIALPGLPMRVRIAIALAAALLVIYMEIAALLQLLGRLFERTEPATT